MELKPKGLALLGYSNFLIKSNFRQLYLLNYWRSKIRFFYFAENVMLFNPQYVFRLRTRKKQFRKTEYEYIHIYKNQNPK